MKLSVLLSLAFAAALALVSPARAENTFTIGLMNDQSGPYADLSGPTSVEMVKMAIEDFGGEVLGKKIELLVADHQNKVDIGLNIARQWYDAKGVEAIFDITNSGVALALVDLAKSRHKLVIFDSASSSDLTGKACSANSFQWNADNWSNGAALMRTLIHEKLDTFFFITADYAFGVSLENDARGAIETAGGSVVGSVRAPLNTADFSSYLLAAQSLGRQGRGARQHRRRSLQLAQTGQRVRHRRDAIYRDADHLSLRRQRGGPDDRSRPHLHAVVVLGPRRFDARLRQALLRTRQAHAQRQPGRALFFGAPLSRGGSGRRQRRFGRVAEAMREKPIHDIFTADGHLREDGRLTYDRYLMRVKQPAESKYPWDYLEVVAKIPAAEAFRPLGTTNCPLTQK